MRSKKRRRAAAKSAGVLPLSLSCAAILSATLGVAACQAQEQQHLRSRIFLYDLRDGSSRLLYSADSVWEAPNWSPDGQYLITNHEGAIYRLAVPASGTTTPIKLAIPPELNCNNDKALSPDGKQLAFSASAAASKGSEVYLAGADGSSPRQMTTETPSYFHGWSPDGKTLAFVAQRRGSTQYDIYGIDTGIDRAGGAEHRLTSNPHQDDGPDYSPDGRWIYINSDRSGKQAVWRFPATGAGPGDEKAELVVNDELEDWFPHISPDGTKMVYLGYPAGTPTHNPRDVAVEIRLVAVEKNKVNAARQTLVKATGGQGTMNVNSWAPDSWRFAYVTYEKLP